MPGSLDIEHDRTSDCHPASWARMDDLTTERRVHSQAVWVIYVLGLTLWHVIHGCLYNQALEDARSTDAGIECLYCTWSSLWVMYWKIMWRSRDTRVRRFSIFLNMNSKLVSLFLFCQGFLTCWKLQNCMLKREIATYSASFPYTIEI